MINAVIRSKMSRIPNPTLLLEIRVSSQRKKSYEMAFLSFGYIENRILCFQSVAVNFSIPDQKDSKSRIRIRIKEFK
jgi:hypothetical protein